METQNEIQNEERIEPKIRVSRDGKWVIIKVPGVEQPIIKSVNYLKAILKNAENRTDTELDYTLRKLNSSGKND